MNRQAFEKRVAALKERERMRVRDLVLCQADVRLQAGLSRIAFAKCLAERADPRLMATLDEAAQQIVAARTTLREFFDNPSTED